MSAVDEEGTQNFLRQKKGFLQSQWTCMMLFCLFDGDGYFMWSHFAWESNQLRMPTVKRMYTFSWKEWHKGSNKFPFLLTISLIHQPYTEVQLTTLYSKVNMSKMYFDFEDDQ